MADRSAIEWTDATWNPTVGCSIVSPGCTNCYAMKMAARLEAMGQTIYKGMTQPLKAGAVWTGKVELSNHGQLIKPMSWKKPRRIFVNSMSDLFHESLPDEVIDKVFAVMALCPQHTFQILTKRAERMMQWFAHVERADYVGLAMLTLVDRIPHGHRRVPWPLPNVWLGVSTERQQEADERIPLLLQTPAAVRFISAEPLLGPIDLTNIGSSTDRSAQLGINALNGHSVRPAADRDFGKCWPPLDWVIAGGESGPRARSMLPAWPRSLRDQCAAAGVAYFFKQWGGYLPVGQSLPGCGKISGGTAVKPGRMKLHYRGAPQQSPKHSFAERGVEFASTADGRLTFRVGKKAAGRLLDGREHNEFPNVVTAKSEAA